MPSLIFFIAVTATSVCIGLCTPLRPVELFLKLYFIALPLTFAALYAITYQLRAESAHAPEEQMTRQVGTQPISLRFAGLHRTLLKTAFWLSLLFVDAAVAINEYADNSPGQPVTVRVLSRHTTNHRNGRETYRATVESPVPSDLPFSFGRTENIDISYEYYASIVPGHTRMTLTLHPGFLGFPWYERGLRLVWK